VDRLLQRRCLISRLARVRGGAAEIGGDRGGTGEDVVVYP